MISLIPSLVGAILGLLALSAISVIGERDLLPDYVIEDDIY